MENIIRFESVEYIKPGIGYFPKLEKQLKHGFSWGKESANMSYSHGNSGEVHVRNRQFFNDLELGEIKDSLTLYPEQSDRITFIDDIGILVDLKKSPRGRYIKGDALFTTIPDQALAVKPADCTTAIVYAENSKGTKLTGLIHTGWKGVDKALAQKAIKFLEGKDFKPEEIILAIVPAISHKFRTFEYLGFEHIDHDTDLIYKDKNGLYHFDQTLGALRQYIDAGIKDSNIYLYDVDTYEATKKGEGLSEKYFMNNNLQQARFIVATSLNR